jgi:hypothetical protein
MCLQVGRMGPESEDGPRQNNWDRSEGAWGRAAVAARTAVLKRARFLRPSTGNPTVAAGSTKDGRKPSAATNSRKDGKALSETLALKPERGKPVFRNFREGDGNVGIIRSRLRAIALPDYKKGGSDSILALRLAGDSARCHGKRRQGYRWAGLWSLEKRKSRTPTLSG